MTKLTKEIMRPSTRPDCWKAHGSVVTADPIIVFHALKMMMIELCFSPIGAVIIVGQQRVRGKLTWLVERVMYQEQVMVDNMTWRLKKSLVFLAKVLETSSQRWIVLISVVVTVRVTWWKHGRPWASRGKCAIVFRVVCTLRTKKFCSSAHFNVLWRGCCWLIYFVICAWQRK